MRTPRTPHMFSGYVDGLRRLLVTTLVVAFALLPAPGEAAAPGERSRSDAIRVRLTQLHWLGDVPGQTVERSRVGVAEFLFGSQMTQLLRQNGGGYINLVTQASRSRQPRWSVRNLYLSYPDVDAMLGSSPSVMFDLDVQNGTRLLTSFFDVFVTVEPLLQAPNALPRRKAKIGLEGYHVGGRDGGGSGQLPLPLLIGPWICPPVLPVRAVEITVDVDDLVEVDEADMGCAPGAVTRSIKYMMGACGIATEGTEDMDGHLGEDMGTDETGTNDDNLLAGKNEYVSDHDLPIDSELQFWGEDFEDLGGIMDALEAGADIELLISWDTDPPSGHVAMVTSIVQLADGSYLITYVDDPHQGDGTAENEEHVIHVGADGSFDGGTVDGFLVETPTCGG